MERVRVGFVGAGSRARLSHYPSVAELSDLAEMVAICDLDEALLNSTGERYGIDARFTDLHEMLESVDIDAVYCVLPPMHLEAVAMPCLEAGKHVFSEKPLADSHASAQRLADAAQAHGCMTMVAFNRRFAPINLHCMELIAEHGGPTQVIVEYHKDMLGGPSYYDISIMVTDVAHAVDATRWWLGEPTEVRSTVRRMHNDWDNVFNSLMTYESGAIGILTANRASGTRYERVEAHGKGIACYIHAPERAEIWMQGSKEPTIVTGAELAGTDDNHVTYGFLGENRHFLECVRDGVPPQPDFADAAQTMQLCERLQQEEW